MFALRQHIVTTGGDNIHIFSAPEGTKPIYSDSKTAMEQYFPISNQLGKGSLITFLIMVLLHSIMYIFDFSGWKDLVINISAIIAMIVFIFNFLPYLGYKHRVNNMKKEAGNY